MSKWREKNAPATGGGQSPGTGMAPGSEHTPASGGYRSAPKQIAPNTKVNASHIHTWCWTGALQGARVYMAARQWSLEQMESQVGQVPDILEYARTRKDLTQNHASKHNLYLTIQGGFCITIGWSAYLDKPGMSHGWFQAGAGASSSQERLYKALEVMLMCMGYDCPSDCTPIEPAPGGMKSTRSKNKNKKNRRAKQAQEQQTNLKEQQPRPQAPEPVAAAASAGAASSSAGSASLARAITAPPPTPVATSELASGSEQQLHQLPSEPQPQPQPQPPPQQSSQQPPRQEHTPYHTPQPGTTNELASGSKQQLPQQQEQQEQLQLPEQQEQLQLPQQQEQQVQPQQPQQPQQAEQQVQQQPLGQTLQQQPQQLQPQPMAMWPPGLPMATMALQQHAVMVSAVSQQQHQWQHVQPQQQQELQFQQQWHQQHQDQLLQQQLLQQWQHGQEQQQQQQQQQQQLLQQQQLQQQIWQLQQQVWSQQQQQQQLLQQIGQQHRDLQPQQQQQQQPPPLHGTSPASGGTESEESEIEDESDEEEEEEEETWTWTEEDQARWREAVARVCRVRGRHPQRGRANLYQKRAPAVKLEEADMDRMSTLMQAVAGWGGFSSRDLVRRDGIQNSTKRMLGKQLEMLKTTALLFYCLDCHQIRAGLWRHHHQIRQQHGSSLRIF